MRRPSRRQFLGHCLTALALIQVTVVTADAVLRRMTPVRHHPTPPAL